MGVKKTEAFVLKTFNWSESSRTISFFTRDQGKLPLSDRGGRSLKSKRGRALTFARLAITYYDSERASAGHLSDTETLEAWTFEGEAVLGRLAFASAACEILWLVLPDSEPHRDIYGYTIKYFRLLNSENRRSLPGLFLAYTFRLLSMLGYQPMMSGCLVCVRRLDELDTHRVRFSPARGGLICGSCQIGAESYITLSPEDLVLCIHLQAGSLEEAGAFALNFTQMNRLADMLLRFLREQTGIRKLNSLEFLDKLKIAQSGPT